MNPKYSDIEQNVQFKITSLVTNDRKNLIDGSNFHVHHRNRTADHRHTSWAWNIMIYTHVKRINNMYYQKMFEKWRSKKRKKKRTKKSNLKNDGRNKRTFFSFRRYFFINFFATNFLHRVEFVCSSRGRRWSPLPLTVIWNFHWLCKKDTNGRLVMWCYVDARSKVVTTQSLC